MKVRALLIIVLISFMWACTPQTDVKRKSGIDYTQYQGVSSLTGTEEQFTGEEEDFVGESRFTSAAAYGDAVVVVGSKKIALGRRATEANMQLFQKSLDKAYLDARRTYNPIGFTYTMSPAGAINPLSDMEVQCVLSQESADSLGQRTCDMFFRSISAEYALALEEAQL